MPETKPDDLMAYCGIDCSKCFGYTKTVSEAAKQLRRTMRAEKIKQVWPSMPFLGDYDVLKKTWMPLPGSDVRGASTGAATPFARYESAASGVTTIAALNVVTSRLVKSSLSLSRATRMSI